MTASRKAWGHPLMLIAYNHLKRRGLLDTWSVAGLQLVLRYGDGNPFHFDSQTGEVVYQQPRLVTSSGEQLPAGLRLLLDGGVLPDGTSRPISFRLQKRTDYTQPRTHRPSAAVVAAAPEMLSLMEGAIFMDDRASGSVGLGGLLHGRGGDCSRISFTISMDLAVALQGAGLWNVAPIHDVIMFFHPPPRWATPLSSTPARAAASTVGAAALARRQSVLPCAPRLLPRS